MAYHTDEITLDIGFSLTSLLYMYMHCAYSNFVKIKLFFLTQSKKPIFNNRAHFNVTSLASNDVNVRGENVVKPPHERSVLVKS